LNLQKITEKIRKHYQSTSPPYLIYKSDPITFPTPNPAKYLITVNMNDLATCGAIPYGITITILLPPNSPSNLIIKFQEELSRICETMQIAILGGHSEVTSSVNTPVYSASMIGFVPSEFYIPRSPVPGDQIICSGWIGAEGTGILLSSHQDFFTSKLSKKEFNSGIEIGKNLAISDRILTINNRWHSSLHLIHDATEGGILGALYECLASLDLGCIVKSDNFPIMPVTRKIGSLLSINPLKLISSGAVIIICDKKDTNKIVSYLNEDLPGSASIIGEITDAGTPLLVDGEELSAPEGDDLIKGLNYFSSIKK
jgi:hydrogenase expression/formation protein HypE